MKKFFTSDPYKVFNKVTFDELSSKDREKRFTNTIINLKTQIFPDYYCMEWEHTINYKDINGNIAEGRSHNPDIALIEKNFDHWVVVEVETVQDSQTEVIKQLKTFVNGDYGITGFVDSLFNKFKEFKNVTRKKIENMLLINPDPKVLCIFNKYNIDFINICRREGSEIMIMEMFTYKKDYIEFGLSELLRPNFLDYDFDEYLLEKDINIFPDEKTLIKMYINNAEYICRENENTIFVELGKGAKRLDMEQNFLDISKDKQGYFIELKNSSIIHRNDFKLKRKMPNKDIFILEVK